MMKNISTFLVAALVSVSASAAVQTADLNHDGTVQAFYDSSTKLYWSDANAFGQFALGTANAKVESATFEGIKNWRLPTLAEFQSLYATQGHASNGDINAAPFSGVQSSWYWTAEPTTPGSTLQTAYRPWNNTVNAFDVNCCSSGSPFTWAVASVPEPQTYAMLLAGLGLMGWIGRRRRLSNLNL